MSTFEPLCHRLDGGLLSHAGTTLQDVVEQLSDVLHRAVAVTAVDRDVPVTSDHGSAQLRPTFDAGDAAHISDGTTVDIHHGPDLVGRLWIASTGRVTWTHAQYEAIDSAVALAARIIGERSPRMPSDRETVMASLLSENEGDRRAAYAAAVSKRWLQRGEGTVVRALMIDTAAGAVERVAFGRALATLRPVPLWLVADLRGVLYVVGPRVDAATDRALADEGARRGIRILGIGTATPLRTADDLRAAADQAAAAAELSASFEEFQPSVDIADLGGWTLLSAVTRDPAWLRVISPAAEALVSHGDQTQRRTIETLLDVGGQVSAACELLFLHRTTLYYRLEKMPEVVRDAMADGMKRSTLHLALKLVRLWESTGRI
ncbi:helix-turn-helix domain-containing protein [Microbacterium rhizomatis]|uniref:PucR family transcriptional regulator n=1 Tax=Microbacterium rhizomatis TaxID=1631477 RepID=A0A5J5J3C4_9MICO|nr:helix-turn-helix domain-containing protein [Microbacterium rhizomatis]KAA9108079.1 PucR family transcriptional regulator [Microbacterium rhizomatis]